MTDKTYKILNLKAENIKRLKVVDITPQEDGAVIISGKNGQGKTSVLDCIEMALAGGTLPDMPIRQGEESGHIVIDLGDLIVRRKITEKGSYLTVETKDGARYQSPQTILDGFMGAISYDPLEFTRMAPKEQYAVISKMTGVDVTAIEAQIKNDETERTIAGRQLKDATAQLAGFQVPADTPDEKIDVSLLNESLLKAHQDSTNYEASYHQLQAKEKNLEKDKQVVADLEAQISKIKLAMGHAEADIESHRKSLVESQKNLLTDDDIAALKKKMSEAQEINTRVELKAARAKKQAEVDSYQGRYDSLDKLIKAGRESKAELIAKANMPIPGLSLEDGAVFYNGVPLSQASSAEQIRVSTAIAMAMNPKLRVIRIKDGSLLDDDSMAIIQGMAKEKDFQLWMEVVNSADPTAVVIEDGEIKPKKKAKTDA